MADYDPKREPYDHRTPLDPCQVTHRDWRKSPKLVFSIHSKMEQSQDYDDDHPVVR